MTIGSGLVVARQECADLWRSGRGPLLLFLFSVLLSVVTYLTSTNQALNFLEQREAVNLVVQLAVAVGVLVTMVVSADAISGERERGTLESLLLTPVSRRAIMAGKLVAALSLWFAAFLVSLPYIWILARGVGIMALALVLGLLVGTTVAAGLGSIGLLISVVSNSNKTSLAASLFLLHRPVRPDPAPQRTAPGLVLRGAAPAQPGGIGLDLRLLGAGRRPPVDAGPVLPRLPAADGGARRWRACARRPSTRPAHGGEERAMRREALVLTALLVVLLAGCRPRRWRCRRLSRWRWSRPRSLPCSAAVSSSRPRSPIPAAQPPARLLAHLNVASIHGSVYVDPEDWAAHRSQEVELQPGEARRLSWEVQAVNSGSFAAYVVVLPFGSTTAAAENLVVTPLATLERRPAVHTEPARSTAGCAAGARAAGACHRRRTTSAAPTIMTSSTEGATAMHRHQTRALAVVGALSMIMSLTACHDAPSIGPESTADAHARRNSHGGPGGRGPAGCSGPSRAAGHMPARVAPRKAGESIVEPPAFSDPTKITNRLFPIADLESALLLGVVDGQPFRSETTLLPDTATVVLDGKPVEVLLSQYAAYLNGRITEVAVDRYAQADDGSVWYLGEDVYDYEGGTVVVSEGTWLAGRDGPPAMIMPADPQVGQVFRPENIPGIVFEEVTITKVGQRMDGPLGPVEGAIVGDGAAPRRQHLREGVRTGLRRVLLRVTKVTRKALSLAVSTNRADAARAGRARPSCSRARGGWSRALAWRTGRPSTPHSQLIKAQWATVSKSPTPTRVGASTRCRPGQTHRRDGHPSAGPDHPGRGAGRPVRPRPRAALPVGAPTSTSAASTCTPSSSGSTRPPATPWASPPRWPLWSGSATGSPARTARTSCGGSMIISPSCGPRPAPATSPQPPTRRRALPTWCALSVRSLGPWAMTASFQACPCFLSSWDCQARGRRHSRVCWRRGTGPCASIRTSG